MPTHDEVFGTIAIELGSQTSGDNCGVSSPGKRSSGDDSIWTISPEKEDYDVSEDDRIMIDQINPRLPTQHVVRFIHRTVLEFFAQPSVESQIREDATQFDEVDFELQAFLALLKLFTPHTFICGPKVHQEPSAPPKSPSLRAGFNFSKSLLKIPRGGQPNIPLSRIADAF